MERLEEIKARKLELRTLLEGEGDVDLDSIKAEIDSLDAEERSINESLEEERRKEQAEIEERKAIADKINSHNLEAKEIRKEIKMEERKYTVADKEYRSAWAKTLMGVELDEIEKKALGDAVTTTATTFVQATADANGINNGGLFIPTSVKEELMEIINKMSPFFNDIRKLEVNGNVDLPFIHSADDANWYVEANQTANEGIEFKRIQLTGWELAKDIVVTWKVEAMAVESFISYLLEELAEKMGRALATACLYGTGSSQPTGATHGLVAVTTGTTFIDKIKATKASLSSDAKVGAVCYISEDVADGIHFYADDNGNYPYLAGLPTIAGMPVKVEPFLTGDDILIGNPKNYVLNFNEPIRIDKEVTVKGRKVTYGGYCVADGNAKTGAFAYHHISASV